MALENALIAKIGGGIVAVGASGGTVAYYKNEIAEMLGLTTYSYLIVKASDVSDQPTDELIHGENKNYQCSIKDTTPTAVVDCEIVEVKFDDKKQIGINKLNSLSFKDENNKKAELNEKYFKVKIDDKSLESIDITSATVKTIELKSKKEGENKKYATLTPQFKVVKSVVHTKDKLLLAVPTSYGGNADSTYTNYQCTIDNLLKTKTACEIQKLTEPQTLISEINFPSMTSAAVTQDQDIVVSKLNVVKFTGENAKNLNQSWKNKVIDFKPYASDKDTPTADKKTYSFKVKTRFFGDISSSTKGVFILE